MSLSPPGSPVVSVIIAVHNEERFVGDAIDSILSQTLSPLELIVIDDASSDATPVILQRIADTRIQVVRNEVNLGLTASLNRGSPRHAVRLSPASTATISRGRIGWHFRLISLSDIRTSALSAVLAGWWMSKAPSSTKRPQFPMTPRFAGDFCWAIRWRIRR